MAILNDSKDNGNRLTVFWEDYETCPLCEGYKVITGKEFLNRKYRLDYNIENDEYLLPFLDEEGDIKTDDVERKCPLCCGTGKIEVVR